IVYQAASVKRSTSKTAELAKMFRETPPHIPLQYLVLAYSLIIGQSQLKMQHIRLRSYCTMLEASLLSALLAVEVIARMRTHPLLQQLFRCHLTWQLLFCKSK